jgi:asparagine synthase (glutamine-hydrolysing)
MSAVAGIVMLEGGHPTVAAVGRMTAAMATRGPDGISSWGGRQAALGHCLLRSTAEAVAQPLASEDGQRLLVMDGLVDNRQELTRELLGRGARLRDSSDAELVLRAFEAWGEESPCHIIGEYVFLVWDVRERRLFGARDAVGARHFYFHCRAGRIAFASEIVGLLACEGIAPRLNESRLLDYLVPEFDRDDERGTFYEGIERLPAGHAMRFDARGLATWRHWDPSRLPEARFSSLDECAEALCAELKGAVECRLRSIRPVGAMLSGGLDSSTVATLARDQLGDRLGGPLRTFTLVHPDRESCPEWRAVKALVAEGGLDATFLSPEMRNRTSPLTSNASRH